MNQNRKKNKTVKELNVEVNTMTEKIIDLENQLKEVKDKLEIIMKNNKFNTEPTKTRKETSSSKCDKKKLK